MRDYLEFEIFNELISTLEKESTKLIPNNINFREVKKNKVIKRVYLLNAPTGIDYSVEVSRKEKPIRRWKDERWHQIGFGNLYHNKELIKTNVVYWDVKEPFAGYEVFNNEKNYFEVLSLKDEKKYRIPVFYKHDGRRSYDGRRGVRGNVCVIDGEIPFYLKNSELAVIHKNALKLMVEKVLLTDNIYNWEIPSKKRTILDFLE